MKVLTDSQEIALKTRLKDIIQNAEGIAKLTRRMKGDYFYINVQYLQCLDDDADSIKYLVDEIRARHT